MSISKGMSMDDSLTHSSLAKSVFKVGCDAVALDAMGDTRP